MSDCITECITVNVSECGNETDVVVITATGVDTYTNASLVAKTVLLVFTDNAIRIPTDYSFTTATGTIVFDSSIDTGAIIQILYK